MSAPYFFAIDLGTGRTADAVVRRRPIVDGTAIVADDRPNSAA
jgi:hypothetical protein